MVVKSTTDEEIAIIMRSVARGTDTPERGAAAVSRILTAEREKMARVEALVDDQNEVVRDERWEDMYASITPFTQDFDDNTVEFYRIYMCVWYGGGHYWSEQIVDKYTFVISPFELWPWILNEIVTLVDERIDEGIKEQPCSSSG